jgi:hypothetical protein
LGLQNGVKASRSILEIQADQYMNSANNSASKGNEMEATLYHGIALGTNATSQSIYGAWSYFKTIKRIDLAEIVAQNFKPSSEEEASQLTKLMKLGN